MSDLYQPDQVAFSDALDAIKLLSQRDLAVRVPINYVAVPGVSVAAACSGSNTYQASVFAKCVSNLLVTGFRRFTLDLYWDETQDAWSFCPVQLGTTASPSTSVTTSTPVGSSNVPSTASLSTATALGRDVEERQATITTRDLSSARISPIVSATGPVGSAALSNISPLLRVGPYSCTTGTDFTLFLNVLVRHLQITENNLNATTVFLTLNVNHAAIVRGEAFTYGPPARLPSSSQRLGALLDRNATAYQYRPGDLTRERSNLNSSNSWFGIRDYLAPTAGYFTVIKQGDVDTTPNGWPSDGFVEFVQTKRLLTGFGSVSEDMQGYNISQDSSIFAPGVIESRQPYTTSSSGIVTSGCYYSSSKTAVSAVNNSWAVAELQNTNANSAAQDAAGLTKCGIAPALNRSLDNITAAEAVQPYHQFVMSTIWSWALDEPQDNANSSENFHCAVVNAISGRWQVESCSSRHHCACRTNSAPYDWQISSTDLPYDRVDQSCGTGSTFDTPRTALENEYLVSQWRQQRSSSNINDELLFLDFNDLDIATCWVIGQNSTCPYQEVDNSTSRIVVVPTVAAVIVGVLTILTVFVKCAANRQNTRRRRRRGNDEMGDYEGVPA